MTAAQILEQSQNALPPQELQYTHLSLILGASLNWKPIFLVRQTVIIHNHAIGIENGTISFFRASEFLDQPDSSSLASSTLRRPGQRQEEIKVEVINFIDFVKSLKQRVSILKMDVEGAEVSVLEQLYEHDLIQNFDYIFCETHELQFPDLLERTWQLRAQAEASTSAAIYLDWH
ncbi:FkbM family methyltransferase [Ruegeria arenilitoris]|uniref:FkbM family methyltransferase n=1 Tax=Ruegeria arenilitoris TaxID=1173585 RepID=UPI00147FFFC7|nr:FkbM family methyltransferase [Ruegeria arenilitoris]